MLLQFWQVVFWLNFRMSNDAKLFYTAFSTMFIFPVVEICLAFRTYVSYIACSDMTVDNYNGSGSATQYVSCSGGSVAQYGEAGTLITDGYLDTRGAWFTVNVLLASLLQYESFVQWTPFTEAFKHGKAPTLEDK